MQQRTREKIALVVFLALIVVTLVSSIAYLNVGHTWNNAATRIDDAYGSMDGYIVVTYQGLSTPTAQEAAAQIEPLTFPAVNESYREKGASVIPVNLMDLGRYQDGTIVKREGKRIAIFSITAKPAKGALEKRIAHYREDQAVDYVICLTTDESYLASVDDGVDISICTHNKQDDSIEKPESIYFAQSPATGRIGVVFISSSNVISSRNLESL